MKKRIVMFILLALLAIMACFGDSISIQVKVTRVSTDWKSWKAQVTPPLPANPATGIEYCVRVRIVNSQGKGSSNIVRNALNPASLSNNTNAKNPITLSVYFGYYVSNGHGGGSSYRITQDIDVSLAEKNVPN